MQLFNSLASTVHNVKSAIHDVKSTVKHEMMTNGYYKVFSPDCFAEGAIIDTTFDTLSTIFSNLNSLDLANQLKVCKKWKLLENKPEFKTILIKALDRDLDFKTSGLMPKDLDNLTNNKNLVLAYLTKGLFKKEIFGEKLLQNEPFMFEALKHNSEVLKYINEDFQLNHSEEILAFMDKSPEIIKHTTPSFQIKNKSAIALLSAQSKNIKVMSQFICKELKNDKDFLYSQREHLLNESLDLMISLAARVKNIENKFDIPEKDYQVINSSFQKGFNLNLLNYKNDPELIEKMKNVFHSISLDNPKLALELAHHDV